MRRMIGLLAVKYVHVETGWEWTWGTGDLFLSALHGLMGTGGGHDGHKLPIYFKKQKGTFL